MLVFQRAEQNLAHVFGFGQQFVGASFFRLQGLRGTAVLGNVRGDALQADDASGIVAQGRLGRQVAAFLAIGQKQLFCVALPGLAGIEDTAVGSGNGPRAGKRQQASVVAAENFFFTALQEAAKSRIDIGVAPVDIFLKDQRVDLVHDVGQPLAFFVQLAGAGPYPPAQAVIP